jgi:hypothetical protein
LLPADIPVDRGTDENATPIVARDGDLLAAQRAEGGSRLQNDKAPAVGYDGVGIWNIWTGDVDAAVPRALLFEAPSDIPVTFRQALAHRCLGHEGFPPWTEEATLARRAPDAVISRVLARFEKDVTTDKTDGTRAALVLDESVCFLASALRDANFQIIKLSHDTDSEMRKDLLAHRIVVTKETAPYLDDAHGIVGLDAFAGLDASLEHAENKTAQAISKAVSEFGLSFQRSAYVLMLHPRGEHVFQRIG